MFSLASAASSRVDTSRVNPPFTAGPSARAYVDPAKQLADIIDAKPQASKLAVFKNGVLCSLIGPAAAYAVGASYSFLGILGAAGTLPPIDVGMLGVIAGVGVAIGAGIGGWIGYRSSRAQNAVEIWNARNVALQQAAPMIHHALNAALPWLPEPLRSRLPHASIRVGYDRNGPSIIVHYQGRGYLNPAETEQLHGFLMSTLPPDMQRIAANYSITMAYMGQPPIQH